MNQILILFFSCFFCLSFTFTQTYQNAESVEYDPVNNRWLVSNGNNIIADDGYGNLSFFSSGSAGFGMEVLGNTIFGIDDGVIRGFDLNTESELGSLSIPGTSFLNGMTNDGVDKLYVTDFAADKIYRIDVSDVTNMTYEEIVSNTGSTPNGIIYDGINNRLIFVNWGANAPIKAVDLNDNSVSTIIPTTLGNIDGIDEDSDGNYYISSWSPAQISKFDPDFAEPLEVISTPFIDRPADIGYSLQNDTLGIPIGDDVVFVGLAPEDTTTTSLSDLELNKLNFKIFPNPLSHQSFIQFELEQSEIIQLEVLDQNGKVVQTMLSGNQLAGIHKVLFAGHNLAHGLYYCRLRVDESVVTRQMILVAE